MHRRVAAAALAAAVGAIVPLAPMAQASHHDARPALSYPKLSWKGTITFYAQAYTPWIPSLNLGAGTPHLHAFMKIAQAFERLYPGIKIQFVNPASFDNQTVETMAAGGTLPDVYWNDFDNLNSELPSGIATNLIPYFRQPDPYIPGNKHWGAVMNQEIIAEQETPEGQDYVVNGDYLGVQFFYNKALFARAGIDAPPQTWGQLVADAKRLHQHGIIAGAGIPVYDWWVRDFLGNYLGLAGLKTLATYTRQPGITELDDAIGYHRGILNPAKDPRIMAWWPVVKQLYQYFDPNVTDIPWNAQGAEGNEDVSLFAAGKVAMLFYGTWVNPTFTQAHLHFGSFQLPALTGTSPYATAYNSAADAGGPQAAFQYAIATVRSDSSLKQPGKFQAVLDWVRFFSTPVRDQAVVNENAGEVPTFVGTKAVPSLASLSSQLSSPWFQTDAGEDMTAEGYDQIREIFQEYLTGAISFAAAKADYASTIQAAYRQFVKANHIDIAKY